MSQSFRKNAFWMYFLTFIATPIAFFIKISLSENLTKEDLGILYALISLITLIGTFSDFGISESLKFFLPRFEKQNEKEKIGKLLGISVILSFISGIILFLIFYFGSDFLAKSYLNSPENAILIKNFSLFFIGVNLFNIFYNIFLARGESFISKIGELFRNLGILFSIFFLIFYGNNSLSNFGASWLLGLYFGLLIFVIIGSFKIPEYFGNIIFKIDKKFLKQILKYSFASFLGANSAIILSQIDIQMIWFLLPSENSAIYGNYVTLMTIPFMIATPFLQILLPRISAYFSAGEMGKVLFFKNFSYNFFGILGFLVTGFYLIFYKEIATTLFGEKFLTSGELIIWSVPFLTFLLLLQINYVLLSGFGRPKERFYITIWAILLNFFTNLIFIKLFGVFGAALSTGIGWLFIFFMTHKKVSEDIDTSFDFKFLGKNFLIIFILSFITFYLKNILIISENRFYEFLNLLFIAIIWFGIIIILNKNYFVEIWKTLKKV